MAVTLSSTTLGAVFCLLLGLGFTSWSKFGLQTPKAQLSPYILDQKLLWKHGEAEVDIYRTPLISYTPKGHLLAVAEGRKYSTGDVGPKFVVIRRSLDALGDEWGAEQIIQDDGYVVFDSQNLGNVVVDDEKGIIFIMYAVCNHHYKCNISSTKLLKSTDDGVTWSKPINVSEQIGTQPFAPGPGSGIQKKYPPFKGRLVICGHGALGKEGVYCLLSDDHGTTWRWGGSVKGIPYGSPKKIGDFQPAECQPVELPDGSILVNIRNEMRYHCNCRMVTRSYDGAETFPLQNLYLDEALIEPACAAGMVYHSGVLFFTNPESTTERVNLTLKWSYDEGTTWAGKLQIWDKASGYSSMTAHPGFSPTFMGPRGQSHEAAKPKSLYSARFLANQNLAENQSKPADTACYFGW